MFNQAAVEFKARVDSISLKTMEWYRLSVSQSHTTVLVEDVPAVDGVRDVTKARRLD